MPCPDGPTLFDAPAHTLAKHRLYRRYIEQWLPILVFGAYPRVRIIDGFAGPGRYLGGQDGSPVVALKAVLEHAQLNAMRKRGAQIRLDFIESCKDRYDHLSSELTHFSSVMGVTWHQRAGLFHDVFSEVLDSLEDLGGVLDPSLVFVDPFGPTGFPMELVRRIADHRSCEVLINFAWQPLNEWWLSVPERHGVVDDLFGNKAWRAGLKIGEPWQREQFFVSEYQRSLAQSGWNGVAFRMINERNQTQYYLVYGTKHHLGMRTFKGAAWSVAEDGKFEFSDLREPSQVGFLRQVNEAAVIEDLQRKLVDRFKDRSVPIGELREYVDFHPTARIPHLTRALTILEYETTRHQILDVRKADGSRRNAKSYPDGCIITFAP